MWRKRQKNEGRVENYSFWQPGAPWGLTTTYCAMTNVISRFVARHSFGRLLVLPGPEPQLLSTKQERALRPGWLWDSSNRRIPLQHDGVTSAGSLWQSSTWHHSERGLRGSGGEIWAGEEHCARGGHDQDGLAQGSQPEVSILPTHDSDGDVYFPNCFPCAASYPPRLKKLRKHSVKKMLTLHTWGSFIILPKYAQVQSWILRRRLCFEHCACLSVALANSELCSIFGRTWQGWSLPSVGNHLSIEIAGWQWGRPWKSRQRWRCSHCICKAGQWRTLSSSDLKKVGWEIRLVSKWWLNIRSTNTLQRNSPGRPADWALHRTCGRCRKNSGGESRGRK